VRSFELTIRPAGPADIDAVAALVERAYRGEASRAGWTTEADLLDGQRTDPGEVAAKVISGTGEVLVAVDERGVIVACCELEPRPHGAYFGMFAVEPALQSAGLGRLVLDAAEARARERWSAATMEMTVIGQRTELIAWYERRGYRPTGQVKPFPYGDVTKGVPRRTDLEFVVLAKTLA
jgi:ribosomal protein S18 acetylase RimI-like enzyme